MRQRARRVPRVAVVLSGCGVFDGSEVQESVVALLALQRAGADVVWAAPNVAMPVVINHLSGHATIGESRNVLVESARIARGEVGELAKLGVDELDAAVFPGGYGATRVLCDHASAGRDASVLPEVEVFLRAMHAGRRPLGLMCLAPVVAARVFGAKSVTLGVGAGCAARADMEAWGARVQVLEAQEVAVDRDHRVVCTPAFTATGRLSDVFEGAERMVRALLDLMPVRG